MIELWRNNSEERHQWASKGKNEWEEKRRLDEWGRSQEGNDAMTIHWKASKERENRSLRWVDWTIWVGTDWRKERTEEKWRMIYCKEESLELDRKRRVEIEKNDVVRTPPPLTPLKGSRIELRLRSWGICERDEEWARSIPFFPFSRQTTRIFEKIPLRNGRQGEGMERMKGARREGMRMEKVNEHGQESCVTTSFDLDGVTEWEGSDS